MLVTVIFLTLCNQLRSNQYNWPVSEFVESLFSSVKLEQVLNQLIECENIFSTQSSSVRVPHKDCIFFSSFVMR